MKKENRIVLDGGIHKTLYGKIVDTYAFSKGYEDCGESGESSHLIIKFTDGTFICVGIGTDEWDCYNNTLDNKYCAELSNYRSIPHYIDIHGNFHLLVKLIPLHHKARTQAKSYNTAPEFR